MLHLVHQNGPEILRKVLVVCTDDDFAVSRLQEDKPEVTPETSATEAVSVRVGVIKQVRRIGSEAALAGKLSGIDGVVSVTAGDVNVLLD